MDHPIKRDHSRFRKIVKGKVRENLKKYVSQGELPIAKEDGSFRVPMPWIETPRFKFGEKDQGGLGQGEGNEGDPVNTGKGDKPGQAGQDEGSKELDVELSCEELASILGEGTGASPYRTQREKNHEVRFHPLYVHRNSGAEFPPPLQAFLPGSLEAADDHGNIR